MFVYFSDEQNVLQMHCKLYGWELATSQWKERGGGNLRLNDKLKDDKLCSRLGGYSFVVLYLLYDMRLLFYAFGKF